MSVRAIVVSAIWSSFALYLDFSRAMVAAGVVTAFVLAWRDDLRDRYEPARTGRRRDADWFDHEHFYLE